VALSAQVCPHCRGNLQLDVVVDQPPPDPRARYQAARALSSLGPEAPAFSAAQQALGLPGSLLASGVTRDLARRMSRLIEEHGGRARLAGHEALRAASAPAGGISWLRIAAIVAVAAGIGIFAWNRATSGPEEVDLPARASRARTAGPALSTRELAETATPSTVKLRCAESVGTGFFVAEDLLLTNAHVLCPAGERIQAVFEDGRELPGDAEKSDEWLDAALVRVPGAKARPLPLGDAMALQTGDRVVFIGTPEGLDFTVHEGIVSHSIRSVFGVGYLQIDANVNSGNSGGPLFDTQGRVVGIVSAKIAEADGLGFALPVNYLYAWAGPLLPAPDPAPDTKSWTRVLARVEDADRREVEKARGESSRPALVGLAMLPGRGPAAMVVRLSSGQPSPETLSFTFRNPDRILCSVSSGIESWQRLSSGEKPSASSRYLLWLEKNGLGRDVYQALAPLDLTGCPTEELRQSEMVLDGGDERSDRVEL
jgi:serine protease Do